MLILYVLQIYIFIFYIYIFFRIDEQALNWIFASKI